MMSYKGYVGRASVDTEARIIFGRVVNSRDVITFQGESVAEAEQAFRDSVDVYLEWCAEDGDKPAGPGPIKFAVYAAPETYFALVEEAKDRGLSLNDLVNERLKATPTASKPRTARKSPARPSKARTQSQPTGT